MWLSDRHGLSAGLALILKYPIYSYLDLITVRVYGRVLLRSDSGRVAVGCGCQRSLRGFRCGREAVSCGARAVRAGTSIPNTTVRSGYKEQQNYDPDWVVCTHRVGARRAVR